MSEPVCPKVPAHTREVVDRQDILGTQLAGELEAWFSVGESQVVIRGYAILEKIGQGGMGVVFRARQESSGREVALKMVVPDALGSPEARQRFLIEVEAMAAVQHPALMPLYDAGEDEHGRPWLTMMYAAGGTLAKRIADYARQWRRSAELMAVLARAVAYAHERGVLHRDLKPSNILFDAAGHAFVADFGLAKWTDEDGSLTRTTCVLGSPAYLAPEAAASGSKATTTVSDVYGLGAIFYELLCGARPYAGANAAEVLTLVREQAPVALRVNAPGIPRDLEVIVLKAMAREPGQRYATAAALADDVQRWLDGLPILARPLGPVGRLASWARRKPALAALSALLAASLVAGGGLLWRANQRLTTSLNDVEARVEFMTRELPASLKPLGRLDLLDSVFANVAEHYAQDPGREPAQLARRADFMTEWSQILSPRGDTKGVIARLEQALALARQATAGARPAEIAAARARVLAGWRMGEALIKDAQLDRAEAVLNETLAFAAGQRTEDLAFRALVAQLTLEQAFLHLKRKAPDKSVAAAEASMKLWSALQPQLEADGSPRSQDTLVTAAQTHLVLAQIHRARGDQAANDDALRHALEEAERLVKWKPENLQFTYHHALALLVAADKLTDPPEGQRALVEQADGLLVSLLEHDPSNVHWRITAAEATMMLHRLAKAAKDEAGKTHWALLVEERSAPLFRYYITDLEHLRLISHFAMFCGSYYYSQKDWPRTQAYWLQSLRALQRYRRISGDPGMTATVKDRVDRAVELLTKAIGEAAARAWRADVENEPSR